MSFLSSTFNRELLKSDPVVPTFERVVRSADDGSDFISFEPADLESLKRANSPALMFNISTLVKSGIDPAKISGHSVSASRLDEQSKISSVADNVNRYFDSLGTEVKESE